MFGKTILFGLVLALPLVLGIDRSPASELDDWLSATAAEQMAAAVDMKADAPLDSLAIWPFHRRATQLPHHTKPAPAKPEATVTTPAAARCSADCFCGDCACTYPGQCLIERYAADKVVVRACDGQNCTQRIYTNPTPSSGDTVYLERSAAGWGSTLTRKHQGEAPPAAPAAACASCGSAAGSSCSGNSCGRGAFGRLFGRFRCR